MTVQAQPMRTITLSLPGEARRWNVQVSTADEAKLAAVLAGRAKASVRVKIDESADTSGHDIAAAETIDFEKLPASVMASDKPVGAAPSGIPSTENVPGPDSPRNRLAPRTASVSDPRTPSGLVFSAYQSFMKFMFSVRPL